MFQGCCYFLEYECECTQYKVNYMFRFLFFYFFIFYFFLTLRQQSTRCLSPKTFCTHAQRMRNASTSWSAWCSTPTPTSWTSNALAVIQKFLALLGKGQRLALMRNIGIYSMNLYTFWYYSMHLNQMNRSKIELVFMSCRDLKRFWRQIYHILLDVG